MNEIDRVHYFSTSVFDSGSKQKVRSIIVKYKSWELRSAFCKACRINLMNGRKKLDAKKRRYILLKKPRVKDNPSVAFAFDDINCSLALRFNDNTYKYFNSENEPRKLFRIIIAYFVFNRSEVECVKSFVLKCVKSLRNICEKMFLLGGIFSQLFFSLCLCWEWAPLLLLFGDCLTYNLPLLFEIKELL